MDFVIPRVEDPPDTAPDSEKEAAQQANKALSGLTRRLAELDPTASRIRFGAVLLLALGAVTGAIVAIVAALKGSDAATIAGVLSSLGSLAVGALMNPLQTVERDIIIRRWSDVIVSSWALSIAAGRPPASALRQASEEFGKLCSAYAALTSKSLETIGLSFGSAAEEDSKKKDDEALSLTVPSAQELAKGAGIRKLTEAVATGGVGSYAYAAEGLPPGLALTPNGGEFVGSVAADAEARDWNVTVTVTDLGSDADPKTTASGRFIWTILEAGD